MSRNCNLLILFLTIAVKTASAQDDCSKKCDCYHPPVGTGCEKCCKFTNGKILSVNKNEVVLQFEDASGKTVKKTFSVDKKTENIGAMKPGMNVRVYSAAGGSSVATAVEEAPISKSRVPM